MRKGTKRNIVDVALVLFGTLLVASGVYFFLAPNHIVPGGVSGLATAINYLTSVEIGLLNLLFNIPLLAIGFFFLGRGFFFKTLLSVVSFTVFYDGLLRYFPPYIGEWLLAALFGGLLLGAGISLTFLAGACTGGVDILAKTLQRFFPHLRVGTLMFLIDGCIVIFAIFAYRDITTAMVAVITIFVIIKVMDAVIYGMDLGKLVVIVTKQGDAVAKTICENSNRGVTKLQSEGGYTKEGHYTLLCVVRNQEYPTLKRHVQAVDPAAFLIVTNASEIVGEGFEKRV